MYFNQFKIFYILPHHLNLHKKVCLQLFDLRKYAKGSKARKFYDMHGEK